MFHVPSVLWCITVEVVSNVCTVVRRGELWVDV